VVGLTIAAAMSRRCTPLLGIEFTVNQLPIIHETPLAVRANRLPLAGLHPSTLAVVLLEPQRPRSIQRLRSERLAAPASLRLRLTRLRSERLAAPASLRLRLTRLRSERLALQRLRLIQRLPLVRVEARLQRSIQRLRSERPTERVTARLQRLTPTLVALRIMQLVRADRLPLTVTPQLSFTSG